MAQKTHTRRPKPPASRGPPPKLSAELQAKIGEKLKEMHDDVIRQGVPARFAELLARLDDQARKEPK